LKSAYGTFFLYKFWKSFVFLAVTGETLVDAGKLWKFRKPNISQIGMTYILDRKVWRILSQMGHPNVGVYVKSILSNVKVTPSMTRQGPTHFTARIVFLLSISERNTTSNPTTMMPRLMSRGMFQ
jgi:hypothetical protein